MNIESLHSITRLIRQSLKTWLLIAICMLSSGCSMDEEVISECERVHPNSLQGQLVCQSRVAARNEIIRKEKEAKTCVDADESRMRKIAFEIQGVVKNSTNLNITELNKKLEQQFQNLKFNIQNQKQNNSRKVIVFNLNTICDLSKYEFLINIFDGDGSGNGTEFRVWENSPPQDITNHNRLLPELSWNKK